MLAMGGYYSNQSSWPFEQVALFDQSLASVSKSKSVQSSCSGSVSNSKKDAVKSESQATKKKKWRAVLGHERKDGGRQRNFNGIGVAGGEIVNDACEKHVKKSAANLITAIRPGEARELHLRNCFAAKRALRQMASNMLAAEYTATLIRNRSCHCTHAAAHPLFLG